MWSTPYPGLWRNEAPLNHQPTITVRLPAPGYLAELDPAANPSIAWFLSNKWYRQTYYAISPGFAPGGVPPGNPAVCNPLPATPSCLTVNNLPPSFVQKNDKQAILVFAGRALDGQTRPSGSPANYLEGENATPADFIFEHRSGVATSINDRVVVVSP